MTEDSLSWVYEIQHDFVKCDPIFLELEWHDRDGRVGWRSRVGTMEMLILLGRKRRVNYMYIKI